jgi:hypothetical protein
MIGAPIGIPIRTSVSVTRAITAERIIGRFGKSATTKESW